MSTYVLCESKLSKNNIISKNSSGLADFLLQLDLYIN